MFEKDSATRYRECSLYEVKQAVKKIKEHILNTFGVSVIVNDQSWGGASNNNLLLYSFSDIK